MFFLHGWNQHDALSELMSLLDAFSAKIEASAQEIFKTSYTFTFTWVYMVHSTFE